MISANTIRTITESVVNYRQALKMLVVGDDWRFNQIFKKALDGKTETTMFGINERDIKEMRDAGLVVTQLNHSHQRGTFMYLVSWRDV